MSAPRLQAGALVIAIAAWLVSGGRLYSQAEAPRTILLDDFETEDIRVVQPDQKNPQQRYLWNQYTQDSGPFGPDGGLASVSPLSVSSDGARSLRVNVTLNNLYLQFYPHNGTVWQWMREFTQPSEDYQNDTFNRLRFWIKVPAAVVPEPQGQANMQVGTYVRRSTADLTSAEDGGGHFYHFFNVPPTGEWHQIIVDSHPNHERGASGSAEHGDKLYVTGEAGFNYFDAMTRFYLDFVNQLRSVPADFYVDGFELYRETRPENVAQIYSVNGVYVPNANTLLVGWMRDKNQNLLKHEVRYAFTDVFQIGWENAEPAPDGLLMPLGWQGYNGMEWRTNAIDVTGRAVIYIAIKPEDSERFRQIAIPIPPGAPTGLSALRRR